MALGVALPRIDRRVDRGLPPWLSDVAFSGSPSAARTVLDAVSSSLITVTSLTFSLTVVTLQLASSQFSPRLLRTFTRDLFVQGTLALFLATFTFSLTALRSVKDAVDTSAGFVPRISVTFGFLLTVASVLGLVLFLAHLAQQIRVETMLRNVHVEASDTVDRVLGADLAEAEDFHWPEPPVAPSLLIVHESGFLVRVDEPALLAAALEHDVMIVIDALPGGSIVAGTPVGAAWPRGGGLTDESTLADLLRRTGESVRVGFERNSVQDVAFGLRQLTDVAAKALSPGINDPTTAIHALGHSSALIGELASRHLGPRVLRGDDGTVRVTLARPGLADLVELAVEQPRRYGASDPLVLGRLFMLLRELAWVHRDRVRSIVFDQLDRLRATVGAQDFDPAEQRRLALLATSVEQCLDGVWKSPRDATGR